MCLIRHRDRTTTRSALSQSSDPGRDHDGGNERDRDGENDRESVAKTVGVWAARWSLKDVAECEPDHDRDPDDRVADEVVDLAVSKSLHWPRLRPVRCDGAPRLS